MMVLASAPRMESTLTQFLRLRVKGQLMHLIRLFRLTAEGTLVHKSDLFREELQLGTDGIQLKLQSFDDGNEDMFVHLIELFFGKTGEICHAAHRFISVSIITEMP